MSQVVYDAQLIQVFGVPKESNTTNIDFTDVAASGIVSSGVFFRVCSTEDCYITTLKAGPGAQATTAGVYLPANIPEVFSIQKDQDAFSAIRRTVNGTLHVTEMEPRGSIGKLNRSL